MNIHEDFASVLLRAWNGSLDFAQLVEQASECDTRMQSPLAAILYQTWLQRNESPLAYVGYFNLGVTLSNLGDLTGAHAAYERAIQLQPGFIQPRLNLGSLFERQGKTELAIEQWKWVESHVSPAQSAQLPLLLMALNQIGRVQENKKQFGDAITRYTQSLSIEPAQPDTLHHWIHLRQKQCLWPIYEPFAGVTLESMQQATSAIAMIALSDDPALQLEAAKLYVANKLRTNVSPLANPKGYGHKKLRIAYLSSDFCLHPVSMLTAELFELHDRNRFEVYGYCWSPQDGSALRNRVMQAMDHFHRIDSLSDEAAAQLIREHEIDILVDLQGQTAGARANILALRPAPLQITYLGLPATTGFPFIDYVIADRFLIPEDIAPHYSEKPLYMPDIYQVSDRKRPVGPIPTRQSCGLPEDKFVFCSLNNNYKITAEMFDTWAKILNRTPDSVLWLLSDNPWAEINLRGEAKKRGIDENRLVFSTRVLPEHYLARYGIADLFLDTFPFNAGTTANDALWMGLPVLTKTGRSFASRMAGALLTAAGLPELITYNLADYEEKAVSLANNKEECKRLREHLEDVRNQGVLFDTPKFVRNLEERLHILVSNLQQIAT